MSKKISNILGGFIIMSVLFSASVFSVSLAHADDYGDSYDSGCCSDSTYTPSYGLDLYPFLRLNIHSVVRFYVLALLTIPLIHRATTRPIPLPTTQHTLRRTILRTRLLTIPLIHRAMTVHIPTALRISMAADTPMAVAAAASIAAAVIPTLLPRRSRLLPALSQ